jgi:hypothetical protein
MQDTMGFTAALEAAYQSYCVMVGLEERKVASPKEGGLANTPLAVKNLELSKPWLESAQKRTRI